MIIMKFGGTSVGSPESIRQVRDIVISRKAYHPVVVVSAFSGVTNLLAAFVNGDQNQDEILQKHKEVVMELWPEPPIELFEYIDSTVTRTLEKSRMLSGNEKSDIIIGLGEQLSSKIVSEFIAGLTPARQYVATELFVTNNHFGAAEIIDDATRRKVQFFQEELPKEVIPVVTGFIGATTDGRITTLGRGGSDYTAALLGYYLGAEEVQIWTDVDGVFTTDPRSNAGAKLLEEITYQEASELAAFGAKVLHPKTMRPAIHGSIPIRIANTFRPNAPTTSIVNRTDRHYEVIAVAVKASVVMVNVYAVEMLLEKGFLARITTIFADFGISIDIVSASETSVSLTLDNNQQLSEAVAKLKEFSDVTVRNDVGLVSLIGQSIAFNPQLLAIVSQELAAMGVELAMVSLGASGINISLVVPTKDIEEIATRLHEVCIEKSNDNWGKR